LKTDRVGGGVAPAGRTKEKGQDFIFLPALNVFSVIVF